MFNLKTRKAQQLGGVKQGRKRPPRKSFSANKKKCNKKKKRKMLHYFIKTVPLIWLYISSSRDGNNSYLDIMSSSQVTKILFLVHK